MYEQLEIPGLESAAEPPAAPSEILEARENLVRENNTQALMELLYAASGRTDRVHPLHARYTGLAEEFHRRIGQELVRSLVATPGFDVRSLFSPAADA